MWQQSWSVSRKHVGMPASYNLRFCCWPAVCCLFSMFWQKLIQNPLKLYGTVLLGPRWFSTSIFYSDKQVILPYLPPEEMPSWNDYSLGSGDEMHSARSVRKKKMNFTLSKYEAAPVWYIQIDSSIVMVLITGNSHLVSVMIAFRLGASLVSKSKVSLSNSFFRAGFLQFYSPW